MLMPPLRPFEVGGGAEGPGVVGLLLLWRLRGDGAHGSHRAGHGGGREQGCRGAGGRWAGRAGERVGEGRARTKININIPLSELVL